MNNSVPEADGIKLAETEERSARAPQGAEGVLKKWAGNKSTERLRRLVELGMLAEKAFKVTYPEDRPGEFIQIKGPEFQRILKLVTP